MAMLPWKTNRYRAILIAQHIFLFIDLFLNSFSALARFNVDVLLVLYVMQDTGTLFAISILYLLFSNTYFFQAGLISILIYKFKLTLIIALAYLGLSIGLHTWTMELLWNNPSVDIHSASFVIVFVFHRIGSVFYYFLYKRTALMLSDPKLYEYSEWIREEFNKRH